MDGLVTHLGQQVAGAGLHLGRVAGNATHAGKQLGAGANLRRIDVVLIERRHAFRKTAGQAALCRHGQQRQVARDRLQVRFADALLGACRGAARRVATAGAVREHRRSHCHVQQQRGSCLVAQRGLGCLPAEPAQAHRAAFRIVDIVGLALDAVGIRGGAHARQDVRFRDGFQQAATDHRLGRAQRNDIRRRAFKGQGGLAQFDRAAIGQQGAGAGEAGHAHTGAPVLRRAGGRDRVHRHRGAVLRMRQLLAMGVGDGYPYRHAVQTLVHCHRRRAAAVVDVAANTGGLVEALALQADGRLVAVIARFAVIAGGEVGVHQPAAFNKALDVLHAGVGVMLLEHEAAIVRIVIRHRTHAAFQGGVRQRHVVQARLHPIPWADTLAHDISELVAVVTQAAVVALQCHLRRRREERRRYFDDIAGYQRTRWNVLAVREATGVEIVMSGEFLDDDGATAVDAVGVAQLVVGRVGHQFADTVGVVAAGHQVAGRHPAVAGHARTVECAHPRHATGLLANLVVLIEYQGRLGHASDAAVVDDFHAPGAVLEILRHEGQVIARTFVHCQAGQRIDGLVGAVADFVPLLAPFAAVACQAACAPAGDQGAVRQRELQRFQRVAIGRQRLHGAAVGRVLEGRGGGAAQCIVAARRLELDFVQRVAVVRRAGHALQADVTGISAQVEEFFGAACAVGHVAQVRPSLAIIRGAQHILFAIGVFPDQLHVADLGLGTEVKLDPGAVFKRAGPTGAQIAVDRQQCTGPLVFQRRRSGRHRLDRHARLAQVDGRRVGILRWRRRRAHRAAREGLDFED